MYLERPIQTGELKDDADARRKPDETDIAVLFPRALHTRNERCDTIAVDEGDVGEVDDDATRTFINSLQQFLSQSLCSIGIETSIEGKDGDSVPLSLSDFHVPPSTEAVPTV
jgi:hypothetical protein